MKYLYNVVIVILFVLFLTGCNNSVNVVISFDSNGGTIVESINTDGKTSVLLPKNPNKEGYTFVGWYLDNNTFNNSFNYDTLLLTPINESFSVYAKWEAINFSITYESNGGYSVNNQASYNIETETFTLLPATKNGHTFLGWFDNSEFDGDSIQNIPTGTSGNIILYAKWIIKVVTITFEENGGSQMTNIVNEYNIELSPPAPPVKVGYTFGGWFKDSNYAEEYTFSTMPPNDITLYAKWNPIIYTISYDLGGGINEFNPSNYTIESPTISLFNPIREGFSFVGWYDNDQFNGELITDITLGTTGNIALYANWTINQYTIFFESNGGLLVESITQNYLTTVFEPVNPTKESYNFIGWFMDPDYTITFSFDTMPSNDVILYAKWNDSYMDMVQVGEIGKTYTIPSNSYFSPDPTCQGGYMIATYETTYELWYNVRIWAQAHGYFFQNSGREGGNGIIGAAPTVNKLRPVTSISWRDVIVWSNALSEMRGLNPVYRTSTGVIIKNSTNFYANIVDSAIQTQNNGYRLPTNYEWEMAARWRNSGGDGSTLNYGRYWTPGSYASGATANTDNEEATREVAWFSFGWQHPNNFSRPVGQLLPNHLGIYDMSGNVWEWIFDLYSGNPNTNRLYRGGSYYTGASDATVRHVRDSDPSEASYLLGFRLVRGQ